MRKFRLLAAVLFITVIVWTIAWFALASFVRAEFSKLADNDGITAARFTCAKFDIGGFPFRFDFTCTAGSLLTGDIHFTVPKIKATVLVYRPTHLIAFPEGPADLTDAFSGAQRRLEWSNGKVSARLTGWRLGRVSLQMGKLILTDTLIGQSELMRADLMELHLLDMPGAWDAGSGRASIAVFAKLEALSLPGPDISGGQAVLEAEISAMPGDLREFELTGLARRWQRNGGAINLIRFDAGDRATSLEATGTLALDSAGRPDGQITLTSDGLAGRLGDLIPAALRGAVLGTSLGGDSYRQILSFKAGVILAGLLPVAVSPSLF